MKLDDTSSRARDLVAIRRLALAMSIAFIALALTLGYWQVGRAPQLVQRDDNPRLVLAEQAIWRGTIFDRNGIPLAITLAEDGALVRRYPEPLAEPLVGYYSLRHGTAWAEAAFDAQLRGSEDKSQINAWQDHLLHKPQIGRPITLTLDLSWQQAAHAALGNAAGVALVANVHNGQILAMVSQPTFDPNTLDADWDQLKADPSAPLLNRVIQGQYQPGSLFQTIVLEEALRAGRISLTDTVTAPEAQVIVSETVLGCAIAPSGSTWADVYAAACPGPFAELAQKTSLAVLWESSRRWQLDKAVEIGLPNAETGQPLMLIPESTNRELALGQGALTITPLHALKLLLTVANDGKNIPISIVDNGTNLTPPSYTIRAEEANVLRGAWGQMCGQNGLAGLAVSGSQQQAWYLGIAPHENPSYALVILIENAQDALEAQNAACQLMITHSGQ